MAVIPHIVPTRSPDQVQMVARLFREYEQAIGVDLSYQDFGSELAGLPGDYVPPRGELLLAMLDGEAIGCVALRPLGQTRAEMKRLFVAPAGRGLGIGKLLAESIIGVGRRIGHQEILLDTLPFMTDAIALYSKLGFEPAEPYNSSPPDSTLFFQLPLS